MRDIEEMLTLDERSSADFILSLRKRWADTVYPAFVDEFMARLMRIITESGPSEHPLREQWDAALLQMAKNNKKTTNPN